MPKAPQFESAPARRPPACGDIGAPMMGTRRPQFSVTNVRMDSSLSSEFAGLVAHSSPIVEPASAFLPGVHLIWLSFLGGFDPEAVRRDRRNRAAARCGSRTFEREAHRERPGRR